MKRKTSPDEFRFVSPQAIRFICHHNADRSAFKPTAVKPGDRIYAHSLRQFFEDRLPQLTVPFVLVSSFNDYTTPGRFAEYLNHPLLLHWWGINQDIEHPKLSRIPLGVDDVCDRWLVRVNAEAIDKRDLLYVNYRQSTNSIRRTLMDTLATQSWVTTAPRTERPEYYRHIRRAHFVLSPPGFGMDCYRTWEALVLGSYPVVKTSPLDPLYRHLPVCIVREWSDVTPELLTATLEAWRTTSFNMDTLTAAYWQSQIRPTPPDGIEEKHG